MKASTHLSEKRARKRRKRKKQSALNVEDAFMLHHGLDRDQARAARLELDARMEAELTPVQRRALFHQIGAAARQTTCTCSNKNREQGEHNLNCESLRGSSTEERRAHYPTAAGSTPAPATNEVNE